MDPTQTAPRQHVALEAEQVVRYWRGELAPSTQTEHRQDKESVQFPADQPPEPNFTRMVDAETAAAALFSIAPESAVANAPGPVFVGAGHGLCAASQTGHGQNKGSTAAGERRFGCGYKDFDHADGFGASVLSTRLLCCRRERADPDRTRTESKPPAPNADRTQTRSEPPANADRAQTDRETRTRPGRNR